MMGDFATPTAANGSSICINNNNINSGINAGNNSNNAGIPKHSAVVERLRQRIEGCRRHHVNCENRYQQAHAEQLEIERRETVSLYQRSLEQRAKKSANNKQQNKQDPESATTAEQRNNTLIALQETVKRKLDSARSPLNGEQNGVCDGSFSPNPKRLRKEAPAGGLDPLAGLPNNAPPASPLHQMDIKPPLGVANNVAGGNSHVPGRPDDLGKNGVLPDIKLNGSLDLDDGFGLLKDMKQEPLDDAAGIESSDTSLSNQNKLFSDINLNDQEWQELIDELANTVPEDDMHDLFNEDFEEKKEAEFTRQAPQTPLPQEPPSAPPPPQSAQMPTGSPQVRPSSSGPPFLGAANGTPPQQQPPQQSPAVAMATGSPANCAARSPQTPTQAQAQAQAASRPGNGFLMNPGSGVGPVPPPGAGGGGPGQGGGGPVQVPPSASELSPAEQLKQMAAQQQQRAKLIQQKHQQQQQQQQNQAANWSPAGAPSSPYGGPFNPDKPNSPMMYPQTFNSQNPMVAAMAGNPQKATMNNYLPPSHMTMISQQSSSMGQNSMSKQQAGMLSYSNTKPLSHFSGVEHMGQRLTPPVANPGKSPMMPYMQAQAGQGAGQGAGQVQVQVPPQAQGQMGGGQGPHLTEEQKRMLLMKQKLSQSMQYAGMQPHAQEQGVVGISRQPGGVQPPLPGPGGVAPGSNANAGAPGYLGNQQQAAMMKQMMQMEQEKRVQLHLMEQQQILREQRQQQQQQQLLAEQLQQQQQQHLPRQLPPQQRNPYPVQQVNQFQGTPQELAARNQALQSIRNARLLAQQQQQQQQQQGMMPMAPVQTPASMPVSAPGQPDMGMAYSAPQGQQGMYPLNPGINQMLQHPNQSGMGMGAHAPAQGQRQPGGAGPAVGMAAGYGQGVMMNPAMPQPQMKGPPMAKAQAQRLQSMMGGGGHQGAPGWAQQQQQQTLQALGGRTSGEMVAFGGGGGGGGGPGFGMQPGQPRIAKQHFPQAVSQSMVDPRAMNPALSGPMGPHLTGQPRTNQPRPMVMTGMGQGVPNMTPFSQGPGQPMVGAGGAYVQAGQTQGYQRAQSQDLTYSYGSQPASAGAFNLPDGVELDSTDGWMDEFFPSQ